VISDPEADAQAAGLAKFQAVTVIGGDNGEFGFWSWSDLQISG
jgi:hypothetical protein